MKKTNFNVVFIFTDQQRYDTMKIYGNTKIKVPNLNKLSEESAVFQNTYVSQPVCTPSRATILTGLYPHTHELVYNNLCLSDEIPTIADMVKEYGYRTGYIGKWHLGNEVICQHGFNEWVSTEDNYRSHYTKEEYRYINCDYYHFLRKKGFRPDCEEGDFLYFSRMFSTRIPEQYSKPAFIANQAAEFIRRNKDQRFMLYINFLEPHPPYYSVYDDMYDPEEVDLPKNFDMEVRKDKPLKYKLKAMSTREFGRHFPLRDEKTWRKLIARYWGAISLVDKYVGEILKSIRKNGLDDKTVVVFTSDHGDMMGDFGMIQKGLMLESAVKVPLLIKIPGITNTKRFTIENPVSHIDLVPTILDIIGTGMPEHLQGRSLYPIIRGHKKLKGNDVFIEYLNKALIKGNSNKPYLDLGNKYRACFGEKLKSEIKRLYGGPTAERTVVTEDGWKLSLKQSGEHELYNLNEDPCELHNLYFTEEYNDRIKILKEKIFSRAMLS
jgi:arylsulfatase